MWSPNCAPCTKTTPANQAIEAKKCSAFLASLHSVWDGDVETVNKMLTEGKNPNKQDSYGNNPMTLAGYAGKTEVARVLLNHGADIQSSDGSITPLHCAAILRASLTTESTAESLRIKIVY